MKTIYLIDGSSMLATNFFATPPNAYKFAKTDEDKAEAIKKALHTSDGRYTNGVLGMVKAILKLHNENEINHLAVCWDDPREDRRALYSGYKSSRKKKPQELEEQFSLMKKVLADMGVPQFTADRFEADDLIGTFSSVLSKLHKVVIITKDRDALQLINNNSTVWLGVKPKQNTEMLNALMDIDDRLKYAPFGYFPFTPEAFQILYQLKNPKQLIDLKGLSGDTSDDIPGVTGIGEKTAIPLLQNFNTIEEFYEAVEPLSIKEAKELLKSKSVKRINPEKMLEHKDIALLSKTLASIETDIPVYNKKTIDDFVFTLNKEKMYGVFEDLEFRSLL
ncbi:5'-3' exonuclease [Bacillus sp. 1P06AnD]|uniref:5'-3' exonuclease n=1 Tax=Bacillus sp. 1P06AnD TaxID=3132208 RepID=UPI0039A24F1A